jgi:hypothetical protein
MANLRVNCGEDARLDHARDTRRKIEGRRFGKGCGGSHAQRSAVDQALQEGSPSGRQEPYRHLHIRPGDQRILGRTRPERGDRALDTVHRENRHGRIRGSHDASGRMRREDQISEPVRWNGREHIRGQRRHIRRVIGVEPGPLDPRRVGEPRHVLRRFIPFDKGGEVPAVLEQ